MSLHDEQAKDWSRDTELTQSTQHYYFTQLVEREIERDRQTDRQTERDRDRERQKQRQGDKK